MLSRPFVVCLGFVLCVYVVGHLVWGEGGHRGAQARRGMGYTRSGGIQLMEEDVEVKVVDMSVDVVQVTGQLEELVVEVMDVHIDQVMLECEDEAQ